MIARPLSGFPIGPEPLWVYSRSTHPVIRTYRPRRRLLYAAYRVIIYSKSFMAIGICPIELFHCALKVYRTVPI